MKNIIAKKIISIMLPVFCAMALLLVVSCADDDDSGVDYKNHKKTVTLRADILQVTKGDGKAPTTMWAFALESKFGATRSKLKVPGPLITIPPQITTLVVRLDNNLPEPTSIVINGQSGDMTPVRNPDGRVRSFTKETPPGNTTAVEYTFTNLKPGTYLYQSGTHPALQVQMGLYGAMKKDFDKKEAYKGITYDIENIIIYSEIDSNLHDAVIAGDYGPGKLVTSTLEFHPNILLWNGYPIGDSFKLGRKVGQKVLMRLVNAGIASHAPMFIGSYVTVVAEDGNPYRYPKKLYSPLLPAGKTMDVLVTIPRERLKIIPDRLITHM